MFGIFLLLSFVPVLSQEDEDTEGGCSGADCVNWVAILFLIGGLLFCCCICRLCGKHIIACLETIFPCLVCECSHISGRKGKEERKKKKEQDRQKKRFQTTIVKQGEINYLL